MARTLVVGYGNALRGDDGIGITAIERLRSLLPEDVELASSVQLGPELAERLSRFDLAVFIDASVEGTPGQVHIEQLGPEASEVGSMTHHVRPQALLELSQTLYGRAPQAMLVTACGKSFEHGAAISPEGLQALEDLCKLVPTLIRDFPSMWI